MEIIDFMAGAAQMSEPERRKLIALYRSTGIRYRYSVLPDFGQPAGNYSFFPNTPGLEPFPAIESRMALYRKHALSLCVQATENCLQQFPDFDRNQITHLVTVSCTGMYAPGIDIELVERLELPTHVQRTAINFMGCYAAFNALKVADTICKASPEAHVLIVCVELCTIHFQKKKTDDHILANALFADGAAAVLVEAEPQSKQALRIESAHCELLLDGKQEMAWHITNFGFEMVLSAYVPDIIKTGIRQMTTKLLNHLKLRLDDIDFFAIHPGGKRILEVIEEQLGLKREDNRYAYHILKEYGNMSSPTILFVLNALWNDLQPEDSGKKILSFAFGPGLTLESLLLQVHTVA